MVALERAWLRENHLGTKNRRKQAFKDRRREFDKQVRLSKRRYKQEKDEELLNIQDKDQREFWRKIGSIGLNQTRQNVIPMEVKLTDDTVSNDLSTVLNHWETEFSNLLNATSDTNDESINLNVSNTDTNQAAINNVEFYGYSTSDELA